MTVIVKSNTTEEKVKTRFFESDIVKQCNELDIMRKSKEYKQIEKLSTGRETMLLDIFYQYLLGNGEVFNPFELKANIDTMQLEYQRKVNGEWIQDDTMKPVGNLSVMYELQDQLWSHTRKDSRGNFLDSFSRTISTALGQKNKARKKKADQMEGTSSVTAAEIKHEMRRSQINTESALRMKEMHMYLEALHLELTGTCYLPPESKAIQAKINAEQAESRMAKADAELEKMMEGLGNKPTKEEVNKLREDI